MRRSRRLVAHVRVAAAVALVAALFAASPAHAAYPRIVLISGAELQKPVVIVNVDDIVAITTAIAKAPSVPADQVEGREYLLLSLFWGDNLWEPYVRDGRLDELRPELANQAGRFYPASGGRAAVIDLLVNGRAGPKQVSEEALATLTRHGVPATLSVEDDGPAIRSWIIVGVVAGLAALVAFGVVARERARRTAGKTRPS